MTVAQWLPTCDSLGPGVCVCVCVCVLSSSVVSDSFAAPWTAAHLAPLPVGFSRQECWSGLSFPIPGHLPDPRV